MSRTLHFGRDILDAPDINLEELLNLMSPKDIQSLVDEMAADPDDVHLPASVRTAYRCSKDPTGPLNRDSLINHINEEGLKTPYKEDLVPFEPGKKRGKVFVPKFTQAEMEAIRRHEAVCEAVKLDDDEETALGGATVNDLMSLAEILDSNPQEFIMEAYSDPLKYYPPDPPNNASPLEVAEKICNNDKATKDVNINNIVDIEEKTLCDIFEGFRHNDQLVRFSAANCNISDFACATLNLAIEKNSALKSLNLESNRISPDSLAGLFEAISHDSNGLVEIRISNQAQNNMGVESRIADAICKNKRLLKVGIQLQFAEVINRVQTHLIANADKLRKDRRKANRSTKAA